MKTVVAVSWILAVLVSFLGTSTGLEFGDVLMRVLGSVLGIYIFGWILTLLATLFEKKETRRESRKATLPYAMILISLLSLFGKIFGGR